MNQEKLMYEVVQIAKTAAKIIEDSKNTTNFELKQDNSYVSLVDIEVEKYISLALKALDPSIPVFGEELGAKGIEEVDRYWLIDPIDGTVWYRMGIPIYGSLIALVENGEPILGCISLPGVEQYCYASKGLGCFFEYKDSKKTVKVSNNTKLGSSLISASGIHGSNVWLENGKHKWNIENIFTKAKTFKITGDCIQHVQVACGNIDAALDTIMKPWDSAAVIICIREAGGVVMDMTGNQKKVMYSDSLISSSTMDLAQELINELKS